MRKIGIILFVFILVSGCSVSRKRNRSKSPAGEVSAIDNLKQSILTQNLSSRNFFIERAEFTIKSSEGEKSGLGTVKFLKPDKFLISIKSNTGIEAVRIYISGDSIFVNDRFNKKLYYGSASYLKEKYGLTTALLPVALGDYVNDNDLDSSEMNCKEGKLNVKGIVRDIGISYLIDCESGKSIMTVPEDIFDGNIPEIKYSDFIKVNGINIPGKIHISEKQYSTSIEIRIKKITVPWEGTIEFIPGKQFKKIHLL